MKQSLALHDELDLPSYNETILRIVRTQVEHATESAIEKQVAANLEELLTPAPERITFSKLCEDYLAYVKGRAEGGCICHGDRHGITSYRMLGQVIEDRRDGLPRPHKAAVILAAYVLLDAYDGEQIWNLTRRQAVGVLLSYRVRHRVPVESLEIECIDGPIAPSWLDQHYGLPGDDDRVSPMSPTAVCACLAGAIIHDGQPSLRRRVTQVVVTDPAHGTRCHLTVPAHFSRPLGTGETAAQRVHAAVAWTFDLTPEQYAPAVEA